MIFRQTAEIRCSYYSNSPGMHVFRRCAACLPLLTQPEGLFTPGTTQINDKRAELNAPHIFTSNKMQMFEYRLQELCHKKWILRQTTMTLCWFCVPTGWTALCSCSLWLLHTVTLTLCFFFKINAQGGQIEVQTTVYWRRRINQET